MPALALALPRRPPGCVGRGGGYLLRAPARRERALVLASAEANSAQPSTSLLAVVSSAASAALAAGALVQVSAPAALITAAYTACPCAHIQSGVQLLGALTALPAAAAAALGSAARVGPGRLSSGTYTRLAGAVLVFTLLSGVGIAVAAPRLALAPWFKTSAAVGLTTLAVAAGTAAGFAPGGLSAAARALPATLVAAATLSPSDSPALARAYGGLSKAAALGAAILAAAAL